jgi:lysophospholipase L1-like esterase
MEHTDEKTHWSVHVADIIKAAVFIVLVLSFLALIVIAYLFLNQPQFVRNVLDELTPTVTPTPMQIKGIGVIGDSQSDEYRADDNRGLTYASTTLNWVEILANNRKLPFGEWGEYEEPRRTGYSYNFARSGATTTSMLESGQHSGVSQLVRAGKVNLVVIYIGANDFAPFVSDDGYEPIYYDNLADIDVKRKVNRLVADIRTAVDTVHAGGEVRMLIVGVPDWGKHLPIQIAFPLPDKRERVTRAVSDVNSQLRRLASEYKAGFADPNAFFDDITQRRKNAEIQVGDQTITQALPSDNPRNAFLEDSIHPGTVLQGLFANYLIQNMNSQLGTSVRLLSDQEILDSAGL